MRTADVDLPKIGSAEMLQPFPSILMIEEAMP
jgi:hypothetical protein